MNQQVAVIPAYEDGITSAKDDFKKLAPATLNYGDEEIFAIQMLTKNKYSMEIANANPRSVQFAMLNVASTGLTLNPAHGYAYLVPRDGQIMLDISYKGLIKIATDSGAIKWVRAECVHEGDEFTYYGPAKEPFIKTDPFRDRGPIIGVYCIAKTSDGDILTEAMNMEAIEQVRSASTAWVKGGPGRKGPWEDYFPEMCRKAVIKRARKTWPYSQGLEKLAQAVEIANQAEGGYTFEAVELTPEEKLAKRKGEHDEALSRHQESVDFIKDRVAAEDWQAMTDEWAAIPEKDQMALWLAVTKGGTFSTAERAAIKNNQVRNMVSQAEGS
jgi:recombination protein RecT